MSEEKLTTKEFIEMWYEHYQKRLNFVLENKAGYDHKKLASSLFKMHKATILELDLAIGLDRNTNIIQTLCGGWPDFAKKELTNWLGSVAPTKNSLRYNDERIMNNTKSEDIDDEKLDGFDRFVKLKTDCNVNTDTLDQLLSDPKK